jgi:uncharacterized protein (DUF2267 family)
MDGEERGREVRAERHAAHVASTYAGFLRDVVEAGANLNFRRTFDTPFAERAVVAVVCAIEQRIRGEEAHQLTAQLPWLLQELVRGSELLSGEKPDKYGKAGFYRRVAAELQLGEDEVEPVVRAVLTTLHRHVSEGEMEDVAAQLPRDLEELWMRRT